MKFDNQIAASGSAAYHRLLSLLELKLKINLKNVSEQEEPPSLFRYTSNILNSHIFFLKSHLGTLVVNTM